MDTAITHATREDRSAALLGWYSGDGGRALFAPDGQLVCYHDDARGLCKRLNAARLARLRGQRAAAAEAKAADADAWAGRATGDEPRASRA